MTKKTLMKWPHSEKGGKGESNMEDKRKIEVCLFVINRDKN